jgi:hypothetical protein
VPLVTHFHDAWPCRSCLQEVNSQLALPSPTVSLPSSTRSSVNSVGGGAARRESAKKDDDQEWKTRQNPILETRQVHMEISQMEEEIPGGRDNLTSGVTRRGSGVFSRSRSSVDDNFEGMKVFCSAVCICLCVCARVCVLTCLSIQTCVCARTNVHVTKYTQHTLIAIMTNVSFRGSMSTRHVHYKFIYMYIGRNRAGTASVGGKINSIFEQRCYQGRPGKAGTFMCVCVPVCVCACLRVSVYPCVSVCVCVCLCKHYIYQL